MKIAITGANGYIGSALVSKCLDYGHDVVAVDIDTTYIDKRALSINCNIFDEAIDHYKELQEPQVLIHLAWRNGFVHNDKSHLEDMPGHFQFLKEMLSSPVKSVSVLGTMHEIGYFEGKMTEDAPQNPSSLYGIAKNSLRQALDTIDKKDVAFHWLRAFYIIGNDIRSNSVFGKLTRSALEGKKTFPLNSGRIKYDFISLDELCEQILAASLQDKVNGIINICSGKAVSLGERIEQFVSDNNLDVKLEYGVFPDRAYDSPIVYGDNARIKSIMDEWKKTSQ